MGNFSFGDYFKEKAIPYAWELVTEGWGLDPDRLWVTVHDSDDEAEEIWADAVGVPRQRIQRLGDKDNFWQMGETGPCGPCSEVFYDYGPEMGRDGGPKDRRRGAVRRDLEPGLHAVRPGRRRHPHAAAQAQHRHRGRARARRRGAAGRRLRVGHRPAPRPHRDGQLGHRQGSRPRRAHRREPADPGRARPVVGHARERRRVPLQRGPGLRAAPHHPPGGAPRLPARHRAARAPQAGVRGHRRDERRPTPSWPPTGTSSRASSRARRSASARRCATAWASSTTSWPTLDRGEALSGSTAFKLHDTYGFPLELTAEITAERGVDVDRAGFESEMAEQRRRAKEARKAGPGAGDQLDAYREIVEEFGLTEFTGYDHDDDRGPRCWRCSRSTTTSSRCSPTARPSTPRPAARSATPA